MSAEDLGMGKRTAGRGWRGALIATAACVLAGAATARAAGDADFEGHPAAAELRRLFPGTAADAAGDVRPTGLTRADYLALIAGGVDYFRGQQRADGAVIDPVTKAEVQYSTPAFAAAAGLLAAEAGRQDLLDPACRALTHSLTALVARQTADRHSDFYIPLIMQAYAALKGVAPAAAREGWERQLAAVDPRTMYRADLRTMNWNIVCFSGEAMRRQAGMVAPDKRDDQGRYLEESVAGHLGRLTPAGMYEDPNAPLAYDAFSRLWLEQVIGAADKPGAYDGAQAGRLREFLTAGGLSSLLLLSPSGEWASGGRSAFHQWNEAELAVICEIEATRWKAAGRPDVAGAFKRAARLALSSMKRWQRPTGELWIVKNRAEPAERLGFESYSAHSQYNLLPMAMLAAAYAHADESIAERPTPAEAGAYVFDLRPTFHKVAAAAGGYYVLIDTAADPHYNATGLQRVQRAGVPFSPLSDSAAGDRAYGPRDAAKLALSPGIEWQGADGAWRSLALFGQKEGALRWVREAALTAGERTADRVSFTIDYALEGDGAEGRHVIEAYTLSKDGVDVTSRVTGPATAVRVRMPALVSDGRDATTVRPAAGGATVTHAGAVLTWTLNGGLKAAAVRFGAGQTVTHQGTVRPLVADVPAGAEVAWRWRLDAAAP
jgi:hypothetical protein